MTKIYALYKGEKYIYSGTIPEIARKLRIKPNSLYRCKSRSYIEMISKQKKNWLRLYELEEEEEAMKDEYKVYIIEKLLELKRKAEEEDKIRRKKRWVSKTSAYGDLINFIREM